MIRRSPGAVTVALALTGVALRAGPASAQLAAGVVVARADHRVDVGFGVEHSTGTLVGGEVHARLRPAVALAVSGRTGSLISRSGGGFDRDVAELGAAVELLPLPWLALESGITVRSYGTVVARQRWTLLRAGVAAHVPLSGDALRADGRATLLPIVAVNGLADAQEAFEASVGMTYTRGRASVAFSYTLERYGFPLAGGGRRLEQLTALVVRGGVDLGWP